MRLCPQCGSPCKVTDSREASDYRRRRYRCMANGEHRWSTIELFAEGARFDLRFKALKSGRIDCKRCASWSPRDARQ